MGTSGEFIGRSILGGYVSLGSWWQPTIKINSLLSERKPPTPPVPTRTAELRWGRASSFEYSIPDGPQAPPYTIQPPGDEPTDDDLPPEPEDQTFEFIEDTETYPRSVTTVRISNPEDDLQYVDVERIDDITFKAPTGIHDAMLAQVAGTVRDIYFKYTLKNSTT